MFFSVNFMGATLPLSEYFELIISELIKEDGSEARDLKAFEFMGSLLQRPINIIVDNTTVSSEEVALATSVYKNNPLFTGLYMFEREEKCFLWDMSTKSYKIVAADSEEWNAAVIRYDYNKEVEVSE